MNTVSISVKILPALNGDCFLIKTPGTVILNDGGYVNNYSSYLKLELQTLQQEGESLSHIIVAYISSIRYWKYTLPRWHTCLARKSMIVFLNASVKEKCCIKPAFKSL